MKDFDLKVCDIQGRLFELSVKNGYDSKKFIESFMNSETAKQLDSDYNFLQWAGEEYILDQLTDEKEIIQNGNTYDLNTIYWMGYIYRYWHYHYNETSKEIYKQANAEAMKRNYLIFHTFDPIVAIEDLKEIHQQAKKK